LNLREISFLDDLFQSLLIEMLGLLQAPDGVAVQVKIELEVRNHPYVPDPLPAIKDRMLVIRQQKYEIGPFSGLPRA
jgi:hypothetical protein